MVFFDQFKLAGLLEFPYLKCLFVHGMMGQCCVIYGNCACSCAAHLNILWSSQSIVPLQPHSSCCLLHCSHDSHRAPSLSSKSHDVDAVVMHQLGIQEFYQAMERRYGKNEHLVRTAFWG